MSKRSKQLSEAVPAALPMMTESDSERWRRRRRREQTQQQLLEVLGMADQDHMFKQSHHAQDEMRRQMRTPNSKQQSGEEEQLQQLQQLDPAMMEEFGGRSVYIKAVQPTYIVLYNNV